MLCRVSGKFFDEDFTGRIAFKEFGYQRSVVFDTQVKTWAGYVSSRSSLSLVRGVESDGTLDGLSFHKRQTIFIGDFCLGWVVDCGDSVFKAEPINHGRLNPTGADGKMTEPFSMWTDAYKFFHHSVPESCRAHLRVADQIIEHTLFSEYLKR
jgi:hypothetical protein